ncbi:hypothetical protein QVD17_21476 [Tagetes erecta]|uniref:Uncharacterized protein n=1 Tax=Tagetes erecta TaxID=13708 RepID=A0AAD8KEI3_TARER|nr:hypothetical protein QVD17_21476 [Tagetes erecta]
MDPYAAQTQTYPQIQPQSQDPYIYQQQYDPSQQQQYDPSQQQQYDPSQQQQYDTSQQQQYDPSQQHYAYYTYDQTQQYPNPAPVYPPEQVVQQPVAQQQTEQENAPIHPPGVPVTTDPSQIAAYQQAYAQPHYQNDPSYYYAQYQQPQQVSYDPSTGHQVQPQWQPPPQGQPVDYGPPPMYPPKLLATSTLYY